MWFDFMTIYLVYSNHFYVAAFFLVFYFLVYLQLLLILLGLHITRLVPHLMLSGVILIWCILNVSINEEDVPPSIEKSKQGNKNN